MKYHIIGNMTGNSMDAIDLVLTEFDEDRIRDICSYSRPYAKEMQEKMAYLRNLVQGKTREQIQNLKDFHSIHDEYIRQIADCINVMCQKFNIDKTTINAIGFHGKTLDHNPPSKAREDKTQPYTLQIGSGQMLANLTGIPVVYDFRSAFIQAGFDGAPLVPPHNAHISKALGDGCYYNGGNTSNFAWIIDGKSVLGADAGPFNEYVDSYIRLNTNKSFDEDGIYGREGKLQTQLLQNFFDIGRAYYERSLPKSGDPQYYHTNEIFQAISHSQVNFNDAVRTLEYFSAYIAVHALILTDKKIILPPHFILFGGGWKNPIIRETFNDLLNGKGYVLPEHKNQFSLFLKRFVFSPTIEYSPLGEMMEARLMADLARYRLENKAWEIPEVIQAQKSIVCGRIAQPQIHSPLQEYLDKVNTASKGWQQNERKIYENYSMGLG